jgi:geranylgeranyl diphosphate synthase type II
VTSPDLELPLTDWATARRAEIDALFAARLATPAAGDPGRLVEAMRYSLLAPGKRVRPLLALAAAEVVLPAPLPGEVQLACAAVELVHCYSLIHDDLPAMDDDDYRRGRPSNHKVFGDAIAILAGDALLTLAFEWIAEAGARSPAPAGFLRACQALAAGAGVHGMVRGQARDLGEPPPETPAALETLHGEKTGALFRAALEVGGAAAGAPPETLALLRRFGVAYGVAFQHADDLADADHAVHAGAARARLDALVTEACATVAPLGIRGKRLADFARALAAVIR